jgi:hypothetical protein
MLRSGTASYYHLDGLGSITSLSSSAGALAQTYAYDNFGKLTSGFSLIPPGTNFPGQVKTLRPSVSLDDVCEARAFLQRSVVTDISST